MSRAFPSAIFVVWKAHAHGIDLSISNATGEWILLGLALLAFAWLAGGLIMPVLA